MKNLTKGNPVKLMLEFALPVCLGNIFQLFYSLADTRIVGSVLGETSLAAVGATTAVSTIAYRLFTGTDQWICHCSGSEFRLWKDRTA